MIITLRAGSDRSSIEQIKAVVARFEGVTPKVYEYKGAKYQIIEIHLIGSTHQVPTEAFEGIEHVRRVVRVSAKYRLIGRHTAEDDTPGFTYNGVDFVDDELHVFAGLCAVDTREHVEEMMRVLQDHGMNCTRMGAYKPRTSPYDFQGLGAECLPYVFELAGKYGVKVISMEVTRAEHIREIRSALTASGDATGVMLQIGTRNAQNFELLKEVGQQRDFPVLFKRGMGITLEESLNACEYIASEGNANIVFCLRGVKSHLGDPHRNLVDFAHVPVIRRRTKLSVCIDPSHSVGRRDRDRDGLADILHVTGQGILAGASMVLVDFHPRPELALCDGPQALLPSQLAKYMDYVGRVRRLAEETRRDFAHEI